MVIAINEYWRETPPVDLLVARYLDYKPPAIDTSQPGVDEQLMRDQAQQAVTSTLLPPHLRAAAEQFLKQFK